MPDLVCIDTQVFIWGVKEQATPGQDIMIDRTKRFIQNLQDKGAEIILPTVVYAEILMRVPQELHQMVQNLITGHFALIPFDSIAAAAFSVIWQHGKNTQTITEAASNGAERDFIKFDSQIIAIALSRKAKCIYSHDRHMTTLAKGLIEVREIPNIAAQPQLPDPPVNEDANHR